jgi:hypothetical protein
MRAVVLTLAYPRLDPKVPFFGVLVSCTQLTPGSVESFTQMLFVRSILISFIPVFNIYPRYPLRDVFIDCFYEMTSTCTL